MLDSYLVLIGGQTLSVGDDDGEASPKKKGLTNCSYQSPEKPEDASNSLLLDQSPFATLGRWQITFGDFTQEAVEPGG